MHRTLVIALLFCIPEVVLAQGDVTNRLNMRMVQVNVIVQGKNGPADNLTNDDFMLFDQGRPRTISYFSADKPAPPVALKGVLPPNTFSNRVNGHGAPPSNLTVILFDGLNTAPADRPNARRQILGLLKGLDPRAKIALYGLSDSLRVLKDFSADATELDRLAEEVTEIMTEHAQVNQALRTYAALEAIAGHVGQIAGRKSLVWVSGNFAINEHDRTPEFSQERERAFRALGHANISVYPVEAAGSPRGLASTTMQELAAVTGGRAPYSVNQLAAAVADAVEDAAVTYTLGFYPQPSELDGEFHAFKIQLKRKGLTARYRKGYVAYKDESPDVRQREFMIDTALWSPLSTAGIALAGRVERVEKPEPDLLQFVVAADAHQMRLRMEDQHWTGKLEVVFAEEDRDGEIIESKRDTVNLKLQPSTYETVMQKGMLFGQVLKTQYRLAQVRVVIYDYDSGQLGSLVIPVEQVK